LKAFSLNITVNFLVRTAAFSEASDAIDTVTAITIANAIAVTAAIGSGINVAVHSFAAITALWARIEKFSP
jgi:hypothetical protein